MDLEEGRRVRYDFIFKLKPKRDGVRRDWRSGEDYVNPVDVTHIAVASWTRQALCVCGLFCKANVRAFLQIAFKCSLMACHLSSKPHLVVDSLAISCPFEK